MAKMRKKKHLSHKKTRSSGWYNFFFKPFPIATRSTQQLVQDYLEYIPAFIQEANKAYAGIIYAS